MRATRTQAAGARITGARLGVLRSRMDGIARKMSNTLLRAGRSGVLNRAKDLSCCIVTADCRLLTAADSLPIHVLSGPDLMARAMHEFHPELNRGDAFLHNSPYHGCSHAADHTILVPVIDAAGTHHFTMLVKAHQADIGNSIATTYMAQARDVYEEGALIFPAVRVQQNYQTNEDIVRMCASRIRVPTQWHGDFLAMIGAARAGERDLLALGDELGWDLLHDFAAQWIAYGERRMQAAISRLPTGSASGASTHDAMPGTPPDGVTVRATVAIDPNTATIEIDLTENLDALPNGLNVSESCARTAALIGIFNGLDPDIPKNAGSFGRVAIRLRPGSAIGGAVHPVSFSVSTTNLADRVAAAVQLAMASLVPGNGVAEVGAVNPPHKGVVSGRDPRTGRPYINQLFLGSTGGPGSAAGDAWLTYSHAGNGGVCFVDSIEMVELHHPLRVMHRRLVPDSEGAGLHCGAPSLEVELGPTAAPLNIAYVSDGVVHAAQGVCGGGAGGRAKQAVQRDGTVTTLAPMGQIVLVPGETVISAGTGGGGYGDPRRRDPQRVRQDVLDRRVTRARAEAVYGVKLDAAVQIDEAATARLRQG
jgi:N-methylhydantoinase B